MKPWVLGSAGNVKLLKLDASARYGATTPSLVAKRARTTGSRPEPFSPALLVELVAHSLCVPCHNSGVIETDLYLF